ncbi:MAG: molybdenum cofactor guanylyltransferase [Sphingopyxis sp.]
MTPPIVIAAGGNGSRIGGGKAGRVLGGIPLLQRAVTFALTQSGTVAIAARADTAITVEPRVPMLIDRADDGGPLAALMSALDFAVACGAQSVLMMPCDMPFLPADLLARLMVEGDAERVAMAMSGARFHPICALWPVAACQAALPAYAAISNGSLIGLAKQIGFDEIAWPDAPYDPFFNINDGDDLAHAEAMLAQNASA